uniref:Aspartate carbamoyltransferase regulatory chain n=1 Tax=Candidatus Methanogaster sp. ANME-2c ERB4 TaxID=2759911 RepID=A0A7G9YQ66_9EURY|nr:aspartate carbamoyltransferase regulatory chain [Methanosarcinales archaeon ANME-2c ERB4]QNO50224.1 aspartate carbamoyltransferase regulatory chain [Methanosarcinales archaeon ANME-2c ERB4]
MTVQSRELRVRRIKNGTVIDHITAGQALNVLRILGITGRSDEVVSVVMNVSDRKKDIVKIENRELDPEEVDTIALISPDATINIIRDYKVEEKHEVILPPHIEGVVRCMNPNCITNTDEPVLAGFEISRGEGVEMRCVYCGKVITDQIADFLI